MTEGEQVIAELREIGPRIVARAAEWEAGRTIPRDIIEKLKEIGVFRVFTPKSHGGIEADLPTALEVVAEAAKIDGSLGWVVMIGNGTGVLLSRVTRALFDRFYSLGPNIIQAGLVRAVGTAEVVPGGYRVNGRWPFASGSPHADVILGGVKILKDGAPVPGMFPGTNLEKIVILPAAEWTIEDSWYVSGLKGTGSHHTSLKDKFVPEENCFDLAGPSCVEGPLYGTIGPFIPLCHAALAIGLAEGTFADLIALANTGKVAYRTRGALQDSQIFQYEVGRVNNEIRAARAYYDTIVAAHWRRALDGTLGDPALFTDNLAAEVWITHTCVQAVDKCYRLGGGTALYDSSPLQRRFRDINAATQHVMPQERHYLTAGQLRLGVPAIPFSA